MLVCYTRTLCVSTTDIAPCPLGSELLLLLLLLRDQVPEHAQAVLWQPFWFASLH